MFQKLILSLLLLAAAPGFSNPNDAEAEAKTIANELTIVTNEIQKDFDQKKEEAIYSFNLNRKLEPIYAKVKSFNDRYPNIKGKFKTEGDRLSLLIDKINGQHAKELKANTVTDENHDECRMVYDVFYKAIDSYRGSDGPSNSQIEQMLKAADSVSSKHPDCAKKILRLKGEMRDTLQAKMTAIKKEGSANVPSPNNKNESQIVSYDEWFTLQKTGIKNGKKYSFIACANGVRNVTAINCALAGSAAKRVFYNTDDIKDIETHKKWVNTINEVKCVTAYVTGGKAFIVDLTDQSKCN